MQAQITTFIKKHHLLNHHATVLIGVSGGPDSMGLLHYFQSIRKQWNLHLVALSADHQLRGEGGKLDLDYVKQMCERWDIPFVGASLNVKQYKQEKSVGTQVAARELRYQFFAEQMKRHQADYLALGHHGDDQIETMVMRLVRSAVSSNFSGIPVKRNFAGGFIIRPMLCLTKAEIEQYCDKHGIIPQIDPTNKETTYTRNYYRKYVVPLLKTKNSNLHTTIQQLSETFHEDEMFLAQKTKNMVTQVVSFHEKKREASFLIDVFKSYPTALQRRAYHLVLNYLYSELPKNLSYIHEDSFFRLLQSEGNNEIDFPCSLKIKKVYDKITFFYEMGTEMPFLSFDDTLHVPGEIALPNGDRMIAVYTYQPEPQHKYSMLIPAKNTDLPLHVRTRQAGDRMSWKGLDGTKKIKDVFIDQKIPVDKRNVWPLVTDDQGAILWLVGLRKRQFTEDHHHLWIQITYEKQSSGGESGE